MSQLPRPRRPATVAARVTGAPNPATIAGRMGARRRPRASRSGRSGCSSASSPARCSSRPCCRRSDGKDITYSEFRTLVEDGRGRVDHGQQQHRRHQRRADQRHRVHAPPARSPLPDADLELLDEKNVDVEFKTPQSSFLGSLIPLLLPVVLIIGFFVWMQRRAAGPDGQRSCRSAGRGPRPTRPTSPATTFADVAGYEGVKQEIREVVDFLQDARAVPRDRRPHPEGRAARRARPAPARPSSRGRWPARPACRSCR